MSCHLGAGSSSSPAKGASVEGAGARACGRAAPFGCACLAPGGSGGQEHALLSRSLWRLTGPISGHRSEAGITSSLLGGPKAAGATAAAEVESRHARRARVTRSWNGGYGTLPEGGGGGGGLWRSRIEFAPDGGGGSAAGGSGGQAKKVSAGNVPQQQFLRSLQRASSTILTKASSVVYGSNNNNSCNHNHNQSVGAWSSADGERPRRLQQHASLSALGDAAAAPRRARIDVLLMPSLKSLVSRRPAAGPAAAAAAAARGGGGGGASGNASAGAPSSSAERDMGGSSSSSVAAKSRSAAAMVPLMRREPSCGSLGARVPIGGSMDALSSVPMGSDDVFTSDGSPSSSRRAAGALSSTGSGGGAMRKCETVLALSNLLRSASSSRTTVHVEPLKAVNRLRVPPQSPLGASSSRMCSRCSSLLSMASSSRYSLNTAGAFVACATPPGEPQTLLCKLCLAEVPVVSTCEILQCGCCFCKDCMRSYFEFEIQEGAYDISCPDAQCDKQGVISISEIENLVSVELVEKHRKFRLNREVDLDVNRTWCPRAGCETVCSICPMERCQPQSVHCPTCTSDFCSNCKNPWHPGLTCEENSQRLAKEGMPDNMEPGIPFDSDLIKCCPMCNVPIEKDEGCAQMMCKRCKHVFCWYCLASLDDDFLLRHYDKGPCKNKLGHSRASVIWHRTQVIGIFAGFGILLLVASPLLLLAAPCIVCCKCRICSGGSKLDSEDEMPEESAS